MGDNKPRKNGQRYAWFYLNVTALRIIIIIIIGGLVSTYKNKNSIHYNVIKRSQKKNSLNKNVFKSFLKCVCVCAWRTASGS